MRTRVAGWQSALFKAFDNARHKPFDWNGWTCFDFAATVYVAITGNVDPRIAFPSYKGERGAVIAMARAGGPAEILTGVLGEPIHPSKAQRGDIVLGDFGTGPQPLVCMGLESFAPGATGLLAVKTLSASMAWEV